MCEVTRPDPRLDTQSRCWVSSRDGILFLAVCACVHGVCKSGPLGDGSCLCFSGYTGPRCDQGEWPGPEGPHKAFSGQRVVMGEDNIVSGDHGSVLSNFHAAFPAYQNLRARRELRGH